MSYHQTRRRDAPGLSALAGQARFMVPALCLCPSVPLCLPEQLRSGTMNQAVENYELDIQGAKWFSVIRQKHVSTAAVLQAQATKCLRQLSLVET